MLTNVYIMYVIILCLTSGSIFYYSLDNIPYAHGDVNADWIGLEWKS